MDEEVKRPTTEYSNQYLKRSYNPHHKLWLACTSIEKMHYCDYYLNTTLSHNQVVYLDIVVFLSVSAGASSIILPSKRCLI